MQIIEGNPLAKKPVQIERPTLADLQGEFDYFRAEYLVRRLLVEGLITLGEAEKIKALNRQTFKPLLAPLMSDKP